MKFLAGTLVPKRSRGLGNPQLSRPERFRELVDLAQWAERVGYDAFGVGERHNPDLLSASPAVILANIAAKTSRIRLVTTVAVLSLTDPVRSAEDYGTLDHLSDGRLDLIIGKGGDAVAPTLSTSTPPSCGTAWRRATSLSGGCGGRRRSPGRAATVRS